MFFQKSLRALLALCLFTLPLPTHSAEIAHALQNPHALAAATAAAGAVGLSSFYALKRLLHPLPEQEVAQELQKRLPVPGIPTMVLDYATDDNVITHIRDENAGKAEVSSFRLHEGSSLSLYVNSSSADPLDSVRYWIFFQIPESVKCVNDLLVDQKNYRIVGKYKADWMMPWAYRHSYYII